MAGQRVCTGVVLLAIALGCLVSSSLGITLNLENQCTDTLTIYWQNGTQPTPNQASVATGGSQPVDVGASWNAGVVWAGNPDKSQADLAEFTIVENGQDTYDISNVNAYDLGIEIHPVTPSGDLCDDITCTIPGLQGFCTSPNVYTPAQNGNAESCKNVDGPQTNNPPCCCPTDNTKKFKTACPDAYSFSTDDASSTFHCDGPTDYNIIFCPAGPSSNHNLPCPQTT